MKEFYIVANSFSAPFFSDESTKFIEAETAEQAISRFRDAYKHPAGLYSAAAYADANAEAKGKKPLAMWLCNHEIEKRRLTKGLDSYSFLGHAPGEFEINGKAHKIENPKRGQFVPV